MSKLRASVSVVGRYAGQCWAPGMVSTTGLWGLDIISRDLRDDVKAEGVSGDIELWVEESTGHKGFFVGDMSSLAANGWKKLATL